jgi:hypothetical protein
MKKLLFLLVPALFAAIPTFAGQSLLLNGTQTAANGSVAAQGINADCRVEFNLLFTASPTNGNPAAASACGLVIQFNAGALQTYFNGEIAGGGSLHNTDLTKFTSNWMNCRIQQIPSGMGGAASWECWDINGVLQDTGHAAYSSTSGSNGNGATIGCTGSQDCSWGFFRILTSTVPPGSGEPDFQTTGDLLDWKLNGSLADTSGNAYTAASSAGTPASSCGSAPCYEATLGQTLVTAVIRTNPWPAWGNTQSWRAGFPAGLDGSNSIQMGDSGGAPTLTWQILSGPSTPIWDSHTITQPTLKGIMMGDYLVQLTATAAVGSTVATQHIGAVATDSNGVVVNADPNVDFLFGPMIAWGKNPWGYQDWWAAHASALRSADYTGAPANNIAGGGWITGASNKPQWEYTGQGTTSFYANCVGPPAFCNTSLGTTLNGSILATDMTITVTDATKLDLTTFPTHIILYAGFGAGQSEEIRICSAASNVLTVCYDGRGQSPQPFASVTPVLQAKVIGSGTKFITDSAAPVCPVGAPGPPGPSFYSTGSVTMTAGSTSIVGSGTTFTSAMTSLYIRVQATHSSTPFIFVATVTFVDGTHLTSSRPFPSTADTASGLSYDVMLAQRTIVLRYPHAIDPSTDGEMMAGTAGGCESETAVYTAPLANLQGNTFDSSRDNPGFNGVHVTGRVYGVTDNTGYTERFGPGSIGYYGENLMHLQLYYSSGLSSALTASHYLSDWWIKSPWGNPDVTPGLPLSIGGEVVGDFAAAILNGSVSWPDLRGYGATGIAYVAGMLANCNSFDDTRDSGYAYAWLILAAIYDPDTASTNAPGGIPWRTYWQNALANMHTADNNCEDQIPGVSNHSFANGFYWNTSFPALTLNPGSAVATGTAIPSTLCNGTASGTATVSHNSNAIGSFSLSVPGGTTALFLTGTTGGGATVFTQSFAYGSGLLGGNWLGDAGSVSWVSGTFDGYPGNGQPQDMLVIAASNSDFTNLQKNWACTWDSSGTFITLNRNWDGAPGVFHAYAGNLAGFGQQPFMLGIKTYGENLLATQTLPALSSYVAPYQTFTANSTGWVWNTGMDQQLFGTNYGRIFQACEPANTAPGGTNFTFRAPGCTYGNEIDAVYLSREQNSETGAAHAIYYQNNPSGPNKTLGDEFYGALWGYCPWTTGGAYCDSSSTAAHASTSNLTDTSIHGGKWPAFFTGMGMSRRWAATRLGGVQPAQNRSLAVGYKLADVSGATKFVVMLTLPSGAVVTNTCTAAAGVCAVTGDARQGDHLLQFRYLDAGNKALTPWAQQVLAVN